MVDRLIGEGIIPSRSVFKPGGFYAGVCGLCSQEIGSSTRLGFVKRFGEVATVAQW